VGFRKLYDSVRANPVIATAIADEIQADPRGVLERLFKLTKKQKTAIEMTTDDELRLRAKALLAELRSKSPARLQFYPIAPPPADGAETGRNEILTCTCLFAARA
jgi:hypothetical protein